MHRERQKGHQERNTGHAQDAIGVVDEGVEPVGDEHDRLARACVEERAEEVAFGDGVEGRGGFVGDDEAGRAVVDAQERACAVGDRARCRMRRQDIEKG